MNLKEQRAAALKAARELMDNAKAEGRDLTEDEASTVDQHFKTVDDLDAKIKAADESQARMKRLAEIKDPEADERPTFNAKSLGEHFVKAVGDRLLEAKGTGGRFSVSSPEFKAATDSQVTTGLTTATVDQTVVPYNRQQPTVADLLGSGSLTGTSLTYFVEAAREGDFTAVAEGGAKPQMHYNYSTQTDALSKIAGFIKVSDEMIEDLPFLVSEINNRLLVDLAIFEESQLLNGSGTAPNLRGILNRSGIQTEASTAAADNADAIFRAITKVQTGTGLAADGVVINPADYQTLRLSKDANDQYYGGGFFTGPYGNGGVPAQPGLWGQRTVVTSAIAAGTVLVGAFNQGGTVYRKGGVRVESTNSHDVDFTNNMNTIRAEERVALAVRRPAAFVEVTLSAL